MKQRTLLLHTILICLLTAAGLLLLSHYDNKYNTAIRPGQANVLSDNRPLFLTDGWTLYPDLLLTQEDIESGSYKGIPAFIGSYANLSPFHADSSPYGYATWSTSLSLEQIDSSLVLWLPEVFSACRVYWNGVLIGSSGSLEPYHGEIRDLTLTLSGPGCGRLVIQTANYRHYYSGIWYPPAIGTAQAIQTMTSVRILFYSFLAFSSLSAALFSTAVWLLGNRMKLSPEPADSLARDYGFLALAFTVRISYPCLQLFRLPWPEFLYCLEDLGSLVGLFFALRIVTTLSGVKNHRLVSGLLLPISGGMCAVGLLLPLLLPRFPAYTELYSMTISWYKLGLALCMILFSFRGMRHHHPYCSFLLSGTAASGICLLAGILSINRWEPVYTGFPEEYGAYLMVLCFACMMVRRSHVLAQEHARLTHHLQDEVKQQTTEIAGLINERQRLLSELLHDVKSPMASVMSYLQLIRDNQIRLDQETRHQIDVISEKCRDITSRMQLIQKLTTSPDMQIHMEIFDLRELLSEYCRSNRPDLEIYDLTLNLSLPEAPCPVRGTREQLSRVLQNLVYNAASFTQPGGSISLALSVEDQQAVLQVSDTGCGIPPEHLPHIFERYYTTRSGEGGQGMGLFITQTILREHHCTITVASEQGRGTTFTIRLPLIFHSF